MVLLGGLEIVAAGYLLNEFNDDKKEQRARRNHRHDHDGRHHSRPSSSRPSGNRPSQSQSLQVPNQGPPRPSSAPPNPPPNGLGPNWQHPPQIQHPPPPNSVPRPQFQQQYPFQNPSGMQFPGPPPHMQNTPTHGLQHPNSFPQQPRPTAQQPFKPPPAGPLTYVDSKTGKVQQNMYPPDHPMARGLAASYFDDSNVDLKKAELYSNPEFTNSHPAELDGRSRHRSRSNVEDGLAYGKYHPQRSDSDFGPTRSYERRRN